MDGVFICVWQSRNPVSREEVTDSERRQSAQNLHTMKRLILAFTALASLTIVTHGQIPPWTREQLVQFYGSRAVNVEGEGSQIKSISFVKQPPHSWHGGECFTLVIGVLRGLCGKDIGGQPEIHGDDNGV